MVENIGIRFDDMVSIENKKRFYIINYIKVLDYIDKMIITKLDEKICSDTFFKYKWARLKYLINEKCWKEMKCFVFMLYYS